MLHPYITTAGCKSEKEFLKKYPTDEAFFKDHPYMHPSALEQNQTLTSPGSHPLSEDFTNVKNSIDRNNNSLPNRQVGGVAGESERALGLKDNIFKKGGCKMKKGGQLKKAQLGEGIPAEVTKGFNDSKSDANLANDPQAFGAMVPNQNIPGVTTSTASQDPQVQNAPLSPTNNQVTTTSQKYKYTLDPEKMNNMIGMGNIISQDIRDRQQMKYQDGQNRLNGITHSSGLNQQGGHGNYDQFGNFRPEQHTPNQPGMFYPMMAKNGGPTGTWDGTTFFQQGGQSQPQFEVGQTYDLPIETIKQLQQAGYKLTKA